MMGDNIKIGDVFMSKHFDSYSGRPPKEVFVVGETKISWILSADKTGKTEWNNFKVKKKDPFGDGKIFTHEEYENRLWIGDHSYKIANAIRGFRDVNKLKLIAEIIGYPTNKTLSEAGVKNLPRNIEGK